MLLKCNDHKTHSLHKQHYINLENSQLEIQTEYLVQGTIGTKTFCFLIEEQSRVNCPRVLSN